MAEQTWKCFLDVRGGVVLSTTIDKYCYVNVRHLPRFFEYKNLITYSKIEKVMDIEEIQHPAVREAMKFLDMHELILSYNADLPARTGLGSSSSFAVGMLNAFYTLKGKYVDKKRLADEAIYLERTLCNEKGGWQDQIAASYGGFNRIDFSSNGYKVSPIIISPDRKKVLNESLMMFFTGFSRYSFDIQNRTEEKIDKKISTLDEIKDLAYEAEKILVNKSRSINEFGELLDLTWKLKKKLGEGISSDSIDAMYETGKAAGALGGKLLGAGGGGFLLFYVPIEKKESVYNALKNYLYVPFKFESTGTDVIYYSPEEYSFEK